MDKKKKKIKKKREKKLEDEIDENHVIFHEIQIC